ncbi:hypothetical protein Tco_0016998 [Tanacetum coccineum]
MKNHNKETSKKDIVPKKPELNDDMYNWIIAKYGTPNENWTDSQFESVADDVYTTFFEKSDPPKDVEDAVKPKVGYVTKITNLEADQAHQNECSSTSKLECSSTSELEFPSSDELGSYLSCYDEFDSSGSLEKSVSDSLKKSISQKGLLKDLLKWYEDEKDEDENEKDEEAEDGKDDSDDELWSPKSIGTTSKSLRSPKMKGTSSKSTPTTTKLVVKSSEPIMNCIIELANITTWEMIVNKTFGVKKEQIKKGKRKLSV